MNVFLWNARARNGHVEATLNHPFPAQVNTWRDYRERLEGKGSKAARQAFAVASATQGRGPQVAGPAPPDDPAAFCRGRFHFDKFKSQAILDWWWRKTREPPADPVAAAALDRAAALKAAAYLLHNGDAAPPAPVPYSRAEEWSATAGWRNGTWYGARGVDPARVPDLVAEAYRAPPPPPPPAPDVDGAVARRRLRLPKRKTLPEPSAACGLAVVDEACASAAAARMPCDRCLPFKADVDPRDDWLNARRRDGRPFQRNSAADEARLTPRRVAPCRGEAPSRPAAEDAATTTQKKRFPWLLFVRKAHRRAWLSRFGGAEAAAASDAMARSAAVWKSTTGLGRPHQTSEIPSSVKSRSIRLIFGRLFPFGRDLELWMKNLRKMIRIRIR